MPKMDLENGWMQACLLLIMFISLLFGNSWKRSPSATDDKSKWIKIGSDTVLIRVKSDKQLNIKFIPVKDLDSTEIYKY